MHGTPYIEHPRAVFSILYNELQCRDLDVLCAALFHDVLEDSVILSKDINEELILNYGSERTLALVRLLTDPRPHMTSDERKEHYMEIWKDRDATLIKVADRLSNLRDVLLTGDKGFVKKYRRRTKNEIMHEDAAPMHNPQMKKLLTDAVNNCKYYAYSKDENATLPKTKIQEKDLR